MANEANMLQHYTHQFACKNIFKSIAESTVYQYYLVGRQERHPVCKKLSSEVVGLFFCLKRGADLHMAQLMPLPLTVSCFSKIQTANCRRFIVSVYVTSNFPIFKRCIYRAIWHK